MNCETYLVTGGAGFIGGTLVRRLLQFGHNVRVLDNFSQENTIATISHHPKLSILNGSVTDADIVSKAVADVDGVFHLAAMSKVGPSLENGSAMVDFCHEQNVRGTIVVLNAIISEQNKLKRRIKIVYAASSTVYGNSPHLPQHEELLPMPQTPYAVSKFEGELYCKLYSDLYCVPTVRLRFFMVFGPNEPSSGPYAVVTGIFRRQKDNGQPLTIHGDGSQTRDFVHVYDIADALIKAMYTAKLSNDTINIGTGEEISIKQIADCIDTKNQIHQPPRTVDLKRTCADTTKMQHVLNFTPTKRILPYLKQEYSLSFQIDRLQIVIACRSNDDDLSWSNILSEYRLPYRSKGLKDLPLPYIEVENQNNMYLHHIIRSYPHFPKYTVFCPGHLTDSETISSVIHQCQKLLNEKDEIRTNQFINLSDNQDAMVFVVHKNRIRARKKYFYERQLLKNPIDNDISHWKTMFNV